MRKALLLLAIGMLVPCCSAQIRAPHPAPDVLAGVVIAHESEGGHRAPLGGAIVGVYRQATSVGGPVRLDPPKPVAMTRTNADGEFRFTGLGQGRWFVLALNEAGDGSWVRFDPAIGAVVTLEVCTDCPVPA